MLTRAQLEALDRADPLAAHRSRFALPAGVVYLDGNSLGPLPAHVPEVLADVVRRQWGTDLITSWNRNEWWTLPGRTADRIACVIGVEPGTVAVGDTTTVALYKAASAARRLRPDRRVILTDSGNFPTDLYVLGSVAEAFAAHLEVVEPEEVEGRIADDVAVLALTHVDYRSGRRHPLGRLTVAAQAAGSLVVWDLAHSAGAMDLDLAEADFAVGCGYKYLNGGPGAPAFIYVHPRHRGNFVNPIAGWWGHVDPFAMRPQFEPAPGIERTQVGTQPIISLAALHAALDVFAGVDTSQLRRKSESLTTTFIRLVDERLEGVEVVTPRDPTARGSHVSLRHPHALAVMTALIERGVVGDVRPPDLLRFGLAPIFQSHAELWDAVEVLRRVLVEEAWREVPRPSGPVT